MVKAFLRHQLLKAGQTFSFETVFSHPSKLDFMQEAVSKKYKCYLYFAAVSSPDICVERVAQRKESGGHGVPEEKIRSRYTRTLENLLDPFVPLRVVVAHNHPCGDPSPSAEDIAITRKLIEAGNRMIRRFIAKGRDISMFSRERIRQIEEWINNYPRKILQFQTAEERYITELAA